MNAKATAIKVCPGCSARYPPDALFCPSDGTPLTPNTLTDLSAGRGSGVSAGEMPGGEAHDTYLGREISGHIEIRNLAGVGAMGRVYRAFQKGIDRDVAVKVLHRELSANQQLVARFHREAKVASRLQHPNVVQVHLAGQLDDGAMYIVMEYLDGLSLQSALAAANGPLPLDRALHIVLQICDAAGEAHSQGVVHRDIKPENVMLIRRGDDSDFVKVLDFGIARLNWGEQSMATAAGLIFGTARYISPEGAQGEQVGPEGDVYATATLLYQMLAGRTPFEGEQAVALLIAQIHDAPPPLRGVPAAANVPESIAAVIMKNLSKVPSERAPDARTFGRALVEAAKSVGLSPEDLVPRSSLFVPKPRLSDPSPSPGVAHVPTPLPQEKSAEKAADSLRAAAMKDIVALVGSAVSLPPGTKTQLWSPPESGVAGSASPSPPSLPGPATSAVSLPPFPSPAPRAAPPAAAPAPSIGRSVDPTLDDSSDIRAPTPEMIAAMTAGSGPTTERGGTEPALPMTPPPSVAITTQRPPPGTSQSQPPPRSVGITRVTPGVAAAFELQAGGGDASARRSLGDGTERRWNVRQLAIVAICFLFGVLGASFVLYELGLFGGAPRAGSIDEAVSHADEALKHNRWDTPPGDNVRDLTNDGLSKWPREQRLIEVRARATDELVKQAVGRKFAGDLPSALHMARLAKELDPTDTTAQHLVDEYERASKSSPSSGSSSTPSSGGASSVAVPPPPPPHGGSAHGPPGGAPKVTLDASSQRPKVGQPVTFTAKVAGASGPAKSIDDPRFAINGPGLATDTKLGAIPGSGGSFAATFAGFEPGKYDITFDAKVDGTAVHATKTVTLEGDAPHAPASASAPTLPSAVPSGKWL